MLNRHKRKRPIPTSDTQDKKQKTRSSHGRKHVATMTSLKVKPSLGTSLADKFPEIAKQWHPTLNAPWTPHDVLPASSFAASWICPQKCPDDDCVHVWNAPIHARTKRKPTGCPHCKGGSNTCRPCCAAKSLANVKYAAVAAQLHPTKNNGLTPRDIFISSNQIVWWKCDKRCQDNIDGTCVHEWQAFVYSRTGKWMNGCPFCAKGGGGNHRPCCAEHSLAHPSYRAIAEQFHPEKNGTFTPRDFFLFSGHHVWWKCNQKCKDNCDGTCKHEWYATIASRTGSGLARPAGCPYCATSGCSMNIKPCCASSSLLHPKHKHVMMQWHPTKNTHILPQNLFPGSHEKVWWTCKKHGAWKASPNTRTHCNSAHGCPACRESHMERDMMLAINQIKTQPSVDHKRTITIHAVAREVILPGSRSTHKLHARDLRADFLVEYSTNSQTTNGVFMIEMDGIQHFEPIAFSASADPDMTLQQARGRDKRKNEWCMQQKMPLLRIGYNVKKEDYLDCVTKFVKRLDTLESNTFFAQFIGAPGMYDVISK